MINKYNEKELAEYILEHGFTSNKKFYELSVISRYLYSDGKTKEQIKEKLIEFCERYFENFNYVKYSATLNKIVNSCSKYKLLQVGQINISEAEVNKCKELVDKSLCEVCFVLLCLYKINKFFRNTNFINEKYSVIMKMARVATRSTFMRILKTLHEKQYIRICINGSIEWIADIENDDNIVIEVKDIDNCGLYYINYINGGYKECELCGKMMRKMTNKKYCNSCAKIVKNKQNKQYYHKNK